MKQICLSIDRVSKSFGKRTVLTDFTADLEPGIHALLGPNGAGKTTLFHILSGNLKPDSGAVYFSDSIGTKENISGMGGRYREKIGFMPQYSELYPNFSVEEFLWYIAALKGVARSDAEKKIPELLCAVELDDVHSQKIRSLSGGMKQRLSLAQAFLGEPKILLLDEPTAGLDPAQRTAVRKLISERSLNTIILISTHVIGDIEDIAKKIILLKAATPPCVLSPNELLDPIHNQVFNVLVPAEKWEDFRREYHVLTFMREAEAVAARILTDNPPVGAKEVPATMEDAYMAKYSQL